MATLTIRDIPDKTKETLRVHAAKAGVSLESYVRQMLKDASNNKEDKQINILDLAEKYFGSKNGIDLELPARTSKRLPVDFE